MLVRQKLNWIPKISFKQLVKEMVDEDFKLAKMNNLINRQNFIKIIKDEKVRIFVAGHRGMAGSAIVKLLRKNKKTKIITKEKHNLDLINQDMVKKFLKRKKIDQVYLAAA